MFVGAINFEAHIILLCTDIDCRMTSRRNPMRIVPMMTYDATHSGSVLMTIVIMMHSLLPLDQWLTLSHNDFFVECLVHTNSSIEALYICDVSYIVLYRYVHNSLWL